MKTMFSKSICSLASLLLALTLTLSCSDTGGGGGTGDDGWQEYQERLKYYDPADPSERCQNNVTEYMCDVNGGTWFNPLNYICGENEEQCDENYNCTYTYALLPIERCGNVHYVSSDSRRCVGGVIQRKCGDVWYNRETHYCDWDYDPNTGIETGTLKAMERCGSKYYEPDEYTECQNGVVVERCGWGENVTWYNADTQYCSYENGDPTVKPLERCGSEYIEPLYERCEKGVILWRCGSMMGENTTWYNHITQTCDWETGTVRDKVRCSK